MKLFLVPLLILSAYAAGSKNTNCTYFTDGSVPFPYCISTPLESSDAVILYLHGLGGSEKTWSETDFGKKLDEAMLLENISATVVSPSFGKSWFLKETPIFAGEETLPPLFPIFTEEFIPFIQSKFPNLPIILLGQSMGGHNTAMFYFKRPELFSCFLMISPALTTLTPFDNEEEKSNYIMRTAAHREKVDLAFTIISSIFQNEEDWLKHSPLDLVQTSDNKKRGPLYLSTGSMDNFGFQEGTTIFSYHLRERDLKSEFHWLNGGGGENHTVIDPSSVANFVRKCL